MKYKLIPENKCCFYLMVLLNVVFLFYLIKKCKFIVTLLKCWEFFSKWGQEHKHNFSLINAPAITSSPVGLFSTLSVGQAFMPPWLSKLTLPEPPLVVSSGFLSVVTSSTLTDSYIMSEVRLIISILSTHSLLTSPHSVKNTDVLDILFDYVINLEQTVCKSK